MTRRKAFNKTGIPRIESVPNHDAWCSFSCVSCGYRNFVLIGNTLLNPQDAYGKCNWECESCAFVHGKSSPLPFKTWPETAIAANDEPARRFWMAFFRSATEKPESYWKQCKTCERILPFFDFSRHKNWGPLEKQMECRACKAVINANLNPLRSTEQLRESAMKRRIAELLVKTDDEKLDVKELFNRFGSKCFKTGVELNIEEPASWQIDHILPAKYFYPLSKQNAALLSTGANQNKSDMWPSQFYSNEELIQLAKITGASLDLLSNKEPVINTDIDVNRCVERFLKLRSGTDLAKRLKELNLLLNKHELSDRLSDDNKQLLKV